MSTSIIFAIFGVVLAISCVGSWQLALRWQNRNRDAQKEDPRDQEIRELSAALNIARKEVEKLGSTSGDQGSEITELKEKLQKTDDSLSNTKEKYNATKENLTKEIEDREGLQEEIRQLQGDLDRSNARLQELEVQSRMDSAGSGFVAGLDDMLDDDEKESFQIRQEHKLLKQQVEDLQSSMQNHEAEAAKWKQHCTVMSKTNKTLRAKLDETAEAQQEIEALREQTESQAEKLTVSEGELAEARNTHKELQAEIEQHQAAIESLNTEAEKTAELQDRVTTLEGEAEELQTQAGRATELETKLQELTEASEATLVENREMRQQLEAVAEIEADNQRLMGELKELRSTSGSELTALQEENRELKVRVEAIENIQAENEELSSRLKESRQIKTDKDRLQDELDAAVQQAKEDAGKCKDLEAKVRALETDTEELEMLRDQARELALEQDASEALRAQLAVKEQEAAAAIEHANEHTTEHDKQLESLQTEIARLTTQLSEQKELSAAHDDQLQTSHSANEQLKTQLTEQEEKLSSSAEQLEEIRSENEELKAELAETSQQSSTSTEKLAKTRSENEELKARLDDLNEQQTQAERARASVEDRLELEQRETCALKQRIEKLSAELKESSTQAAAFDNVATSATTVNADDSSDSSEHTDSLPTLNEAELENQAGNGSDKDDLQQIKGVGAKLEQKLNMLGIVHFRNLLELSDTDYDRAHDLIPSLKSRVERDAWLDQARELHAEKYNETL